MLCLSACLQFISLFLAVFSVNIKTVVCDNLISHIVFSLTKHLTIIQETLRNFRLLLISLNDRKCPQYICLKSGHSDKHTFCHHWATSFDITHFQHSTILYESITYIKMVYEGILSLICNFQNSALKEFGNKFSPFVMKVKLVHLLLVLLSPFFTGWCFRIVQSTSE